MVQVNDVAPDAGLLHPPRNGVLTTPGETVRYRRWPIESGRSVGAANAGVHAATRNVGGARIGARRAKISTTIIAAPQCGQTKVGGTVATGVSVAVGASIAAGTCSSSRAWARCCAAASVGEQAIVANAVEAAGQDVQ